MGIYINPKTDRDARSKRETILKVARRVNGADFLKHNPGKNGEYGVAIIDNGFIAAGIAYSKNEARAFFEGTAGRYVDFCLVHIDKIREMDPNAADALT